MKNRDTEIQYLLALAIDAKCRLDDNFQMFCCLEKLLQQGIGKKVVHQILWMESNDPENHLDGFYPVSVDS